MNETTTPGIDAGDFNKFVKSNIINVGVPGNTRPVILDPSQTYTVATVVGLAGFNPEGYELRVNGERATLDTPVQPGQLVLLLKAVRGA